GCVWPERTLGEMAGSARTREDEKARGRKERACSAATVGAEHAAHRRLFVQPRQRFGQALIAGVAFEVGVEDVLPHATGFGPRLDAREIDALLGEDTEDFVQSPLAVSRAEDDAGLVVTARGRQRTPQYEKPGGVLLSVLNRPVQYRHGCQLGCQLTSDGG